MTFLLRLPVRFGHCDSAGIAYYPRLFELADAAIEDWTVVATGVSRIDMHAVWRLGLPTVDCHASFRTPCRFGEMLDLAVATTDVGRMSVGLQLKATCAGAGRFTVWYKQVLINLETAQAVAWPEAWRDRLLAQRRAA